MTTCPLSCGTETEPRVVDADGVTLFICPECLGVAFDAAILSDLRRNIDLSRLLRPLVAKIRRENSIDPLTQAKNRAFFFRRLAAEIRAASHRSFISVAAFAFDLEELYAELGSRRGDTSVQSIAASLLSTVRSGDDFARVEPNTFGLILRNADVTTAKEIASRIARTAHVAISGSHLLPIQFLVAVAAADDKTPEDTWNDVSAHIKMLRYWSRAEARK